MIRRVIFALLNGLINVLEAIVDEKRDRQEYWLLPPSPPPAPPAEPPEEYPPADVAGVPFGEPVEDPWEDQPGWDTDFLSWETEEPGGETP